jgi:hypothetical protein
VPQQTEGHPPSFSTYLLLVLLYSLNLSSRLYITCYQGLSRHPHLLPLRVLVHLNILITLLRATPEEFLKVSELQESAVPHFVLALSSRSGELVCWVEHLFLLRHVICNGLSETSSSWKGFKWRFYHWGAINEELYHYDGSTASFLLSCVSNDLLTTNTVATDVWTTSWKVIMPFICAPSHVRFRMTTQNCQLIAVV